MKFENIIDEIGHSGPAQKNIISKLLLCGGVYSALNYGNLIHMALPRYRCALFDNDSRGINEENWESGCSVFSSALNRSILCEKWIYDQTEFTSTLATEMNMVCEDDYQRSVIEMLSRLGQMVSAFTVLPLADRFGRKNLLTFGLLSGVTWATLIIFCNSFLQLSFINFMVGISQCLINSCSFTIGAEFVGTEKRVVLAVIYHLAWPIGIFIEATISYFVRDVRVFQCVFLIPVFLSVPAILALPESPRWLICKGKMEKAWKILQWAAKKNGVKLNQTEINVDKLQSTESMLDAFKSTVVRLRIFIASLTYFGNLMVYYAVFLESSNMFGSVRSSLVLGSVFEALALLITYMCLRYYGRKTVVFGGFFFGGFCCCAFSSILFIQIVSSETLLLILMVLAKFFFCISATVIWMYLPELFPTTLRNSIMGLICSFALIGACTAPYVCNLNIFQSDTQNKVLSMNIFGGTAIMSALLILYLPETKTTKLPTNIEEAEDLGCKQFVVD